MYLPKPIYWEMQEDLARILPNGIYHLSSQSQPNTCLGISDKDINQQWSFSLEENNIFRIVLRTS